MKKVVLGLVLIFLIGALGIIATDALIISNAPTESPKVEIRALAAETHVVSTVLIGSTEVQVRALVESFGSQLQVVSLLAPDAASQLERQYSDFVGPELVQKWMANLATPLNPDLLQDLPGRLTSSPWPDRIEIDELKALQPDQYLVTGSVIEVDSTDRDVAQYPVEIKVSLIDGRWLITDWVAGAYQ
jgi:hypothetical protein